MQALSNDPLQRQGTRRLMANLRFVIDRENIDKSMESLGHRIDALRARLVHSADFQARKREVGMRYNSVQSARIRSHLEALYQCLDQTTQTIRKRSPLAMALGLSPDELSQRR